jgi:hypothetical protein
MNAVRRRRDHDAHARRMQSPRDREANPFGASRSGYHCCLFA